MPARRCSMSVASIWSSGARIRLAKSSVTRFCSAAMSASARRMPKLSRVSLAAASSASMVRPHPATHSIRPLLVRSATSAQALRVCASNAPSSRRAAFRP